MDNGFTLEPIAHIRSDFPEKFGIPRQSGLVEALEANVVFTEKYRSPEALRGLNEFSHIWLIWGFTENRHEEWSPTVRPPRLGGNTRMGVFATRSPYRPNRLGLSCVKLLGLKEERGMGTVLRVSGADLMDGTPIFDIKPYLPHADCRPDAVGGFSDPVAGYALRSEIPDELLQRVPVEKREALKGILEQDPRPSYQQDPNRSYGMSFAGLTIHFTVRGDILTVTDITE